MRLNISKLLVIGIWLLVIAATVSPVASQTPTSAIRDSVKNKVAAELAQIRQAVAKKGFVGSISSKSDATITLTTMQNTTRTATVATDTVIKLAGNKDGTPSDLKTGDYVLVMGDVDSQNTMTAKRLLVIGKPPEEKRRVIPGSVTKVSATSLTVQNAKESWTIRISSSAKYTKNTKLSEIKVGDKVIVIGTVGTTANSLTALLVHEPSPANP